MSPDFGEIGLPWGMPDGLLVSRDLFFTSKVTGTASALGLSIEAVPDTAAAIARCQTEPPKAVFVDLAQENGDLAPLCALGLTVIAFGSHVDTARLDAARAAGCTEVMPRSKFSATLPELLKHHL